MTLYKRFYNVFITGIINKIVLPDWRRSDVKCSFGLYEDSDSLSVLTNLQGIVKNLITESQGSLNEFTWTDLPVRERGESKHTRAKYFKNKNSLFGRKKIGSMSWSKIIRINLTDVYVIGGDHQYPALLAREYDVACSCLKIDISTGKIS